MELLETLTVWQWIGVALSLWVAWDLVTGHVYSYRSVRRRDEPVYYWAMMLIWSAVAIWCLFGADILLG